MKTSGKGHVARHPGIQSHSMGELYPYAVVGLGNKGGWIVQHLTTGEEFGRTADGTHLTLNLAHEFAKQLKIHKGE